MTRQLSSLIFFLTMTLGLGVQAGNGVERGRVINGTQTKLNSEIMNYVKTNVESCQTAQLDDQFLITHLQETKDVVDNGIVDTYYLMKMKQLAASGKVMGQIDVEILDSDFSNWKNYSEKLSFKVLNKKGNFCQ